MKTEQHAWVEVGRVVRPHGIQGELRVASFNADSDVLFRVDSVRLVLPDGVAFDKRVVSRRPSSDGILLVFLDGVGDRNSADALRGALVAVPRDVLPEPDDDEFYFHDLVDAEVFLESGELLGRVSGFMTYPTTQVVVVASASGKYEIPLVDDFVVSVDAQARKVVVRDVDDFRA